jgi:hypothetical protein
MNFSKIESAIDGYFFFFWPLEPVPVKARLRSLYGLDRAILS